MILIFKTARDHWRSYLTWTFGALAMVGIQLSIYPTVRSSAAGLTSFLDNFPKAFKQVFRMENYTTGAGFLSTELFSMLLPLIFIAVGASWGASASAQEEEDRTADILLTLPISRVRVLSIKILTAVLAQIVLASILITSLVVGIRFVDLPLGTTKIIAGVMTLLTLGILFNAISTLLGAVWGKKSLALGGAIGLAIAGFLFFSLAPLVNTFERLTPINPFQWTLGSRPLYEGVDVGYTLVSLVVTLALYGTSLFVFQRRDIQA